MTAPSEIVNIAQTLALSAKTNPHGIAVAEPLGCDRTGKIRYRTISFADLHAESDQLARGLLAWGVQPGMRLVLMVPQSIDFITLVFALFKAGVVSILIDPGMGRKNILKCLAATKPDGFVAIPVVQAIRAFLSRKFPRAKWNVTVGRRWFWGGKTLSQIRDLGKSARELPLTKANDEAAIIFTTGSTGPPKGVLYRHGNFAQQVREIREYYGIQPGEVDVACFPLFALFNAGMGVTTILPQMDATRPAKVDPKNILQAVNQNAATQAFGSPALWNVVGRHCEHTGERMPTLKRVLSAGAPVPAHVLERITNVIHPTGNMHTPYGATESLPVASISARELLSPEIRALTQQGAGTCVGTHFSGIEWKVIEINDDPLPEISLTRELPRGEIGELMVRGPVVTREYVTSDTANALHKVLDGENIWHRVGDVGYLDAQERFWFCGRKSHRVTTADATLFTEPCEAIFNQHPAIYRSALVGVGKRGKQRPVLIAEPWPEKWPNSVAKQRELLAELQAWAEKFDHTKSIRHFLLHRSLPVDIRHNSKIFREILAVWAERNLET